MIASDPQDPLEQKVTNGYEASLIAHGISFGPNLGDALGALGSLKVEVLRSSGGAEAGWALDWTFTKIDAHVTGKTFDYSVSCFVPSGTRVRRMLEIIKEKFSFFLDHELREGFRYNGALPFAPHGGRAL